MIIFETTTSVFELLWDIALTIFIIRIAFVYFALTYMSSLFLTYLRLTRLQPMNHLTAPTAEVLTLPFYLLAIALWARTIIVYYEIPRVGGFRIAIGIVASIFMLLAELIGGLVLWGEGMQEWIWESNIVGAGMGIASLVLFSVMPLWLMQFEAKTDEMGESKHGHEKKPIVAAVPTVTVVEKPKQNEIKVN